MPDVFPVAVVFLDGPGMFFDGPGMSFDGPGMSFDGPLIAVSAKLTVFFDEDAAVNGVLEGMPDGVPDPRVVGDADPDGLADSLGEPVLTTGGTPGVVDTVVLGVPWGELLGVVEGVELGVVVLDEAGGMLTTMGLPLMGTTMTGRPSSHGSGSVKFPSTMTSKCRWHPVEKPVVPTKPIPS